MASIKLLLDEDVWLRLAVALREAGYDAVSVNEIGRKGYSDVDQLAFAIEENRVLFTHNIRDFAPLAQQYAQIERSHPGNIVAVQFDKGTLIRRTLALLADVTPGELANTLRFI